MVRIRAWHVPYAYGTNTRMVQNIHTLMTNNNNRVIVVTQLGVTTTMLPLKLVTSLAVASCISASTVQRETLVGANFIIIVIN